MGCFESLIVHPSSLESTLIAKCTAIKERYVASGSGGVCNDGTRAGYFHDTDVSKQGKKVITIDLHTNMQNDMVPKLAHGTNNHKSTNKFTTSAAE